MNFVWDLTLYIFFCMYTENTQFLNLEPRKKPPDGTTSAKSLIPTSAIRGLLQRKSTLQCSCLNLETADFHNEYFEVCAYKINVKGLGGRWD